jgi:hypothetical protein
MVRLGAIAVLAAMLGGCATGVWTKNGVRVDADTAVFSKFELDRLYCDGEASKSALTANRTGFAANVAINSVYHGCMAGKEYIFRQN